MEKADKLSGPEWKKRVKRMLRIRERRVRRLVAALVCDATHSHRLPPGA